MVRVVFDFHHDVSFTDFVSSCKVNGFHLDQRGKKQRNETSTIIRRSSPSLEKILFEVTLKDFCAHTGLNQPKSTFFFFWEQIGLRLQIIPVVPSFFRLTKIAGIFKVKLTDFQIN